MPLTGSQFQQLQQALLSAFPTHSALAQMVRIELDENLDAIAGAGRLTDVVFNLITWAEAKGKSAELLAKAQEANPGNPEMLVVAKEFSGSTDPATRPIQPDNRRSNISRHENDISESALIREAKCMLSNRAILRIGEVLNERFGSSAYDLMEFMFEHDLPSDLHRVFDVPEMPKQVITQVWQSLSPMDKVAYESQFLRLAEAILDEADEITRAYQGQQTIPGELAMRSQQIPWKEIQELKQRLEQDGYSYANGRIIAQSSTINESPKINTAVDNKLVSGPNKRYIAKASEPPAFQQDSRVSTYLIDFVILTALEVERRAVCAALGLMDDQRERRDARVYWRGLLPLKNGEFYEIAVAQSPDMANVDAALLTSDALHHWKPGAALMVGIAAAASEEQRLGDVVVGSDVYYYDRGKVKPEGTRPEAKMYPAEATLWNNVSALPDWTTEILATRPDGSRSRPIVRRGVIASGEKVIASEALRDQIASGHRKIIAIEMEGYGFSAAVWQSFQQVRHLVIRGICDLADSSKNDEWHPYAAATAASFAKHFLLDRPLEPRNITANPQ